MKIRHDIAQQFILKLSRHLEYNINIMNEQGIIIASSDRSRIGEFHQGAYSLIRREHEIIVINSSADGSTGMRPGVNLPITVDENIIGVIGVTGPPDSVKNIAYATKSAVELMLEREYYKELSEKTPNTESLFFNKLLTEISTSYELENLSNKLGYKNDFVRISILFQVFDIEKMNDFLHIVKRSQQNNQQFMITLTEEKNLLVFMPLSIEKEEIIQSFKRQIEKFLSLIKNELERNNIDIQYSVFVGSYQKDLKNYFISYKHSWWLMARYHHIQEKQVRYFYDYVSDYISSELCSKPIEKVFMVFDFLIDGGMKELVTTTVEALRYNGYSIKATADYLKMHRNTVTFRIDKINKTFGMDIINKYTDRELMVTYSQFIRTRNQNYSTDFI